MPSIESPTAQVNLRRLLAHCSSLSAPSSHASKLDSPTILRTQQNLAHARRLVEVIAHSTPTGRDDPFVQDAIRTLDHLEATAFSDDQLPLQERINKAFRRALTPPDEWKARYSDAQLPRLVADTSVLRLEQVVPATATPVDARTQLLGNASELRRRRTSTTPVHSADNPELDSVLQHHRGLQDQLSEELARMASQLKMNSLALGAVLKEDAKVLDEASEKLERSVTRVKAEGGRLGKVTASTRGTFCLTLAVVMVVCLVFMWTFFFMWVFKKKG
ncbi:hypothetical protein SeLEV6574_g01740 [Synchytrium endobioticum]|nr:hypothetical protein SeLEV6574_g01740 [Synchytrium endobioticum]